MTEAELRSKWQGIRPFVWRWPTLSVVLVWLALPLFVVVGIAEGVWDMAACWWDEVVRIQTFRRDVRRGP